MTPRSDHLDAEEAEAAVNHAQRGPRRRKQRELGEMKGIFQSRRLESTFVSQRWKKEKKDIGGGSSTTPLDPFARQRKQKLETTTEGQPIYLKKQNF